jgi:hypothetical protein
MKYPARPILFREIVAVSMQPLLSCALERLGKPGESKITVQLIFGDRPGARRGSVVLKYFELGR